MDSLNAAADAASWRADWAWSLPLIVATVVIHVFGLALLHERVVRAVGRLIERRHFTALFSVVMGIAVLIATILHAAEAGVWAAAYWLLGALPNVRSSVLFSLGAMDHLRRQQPHSAGPPAAVGRTRGAERDHFCLG
jgi:hypothetical protein